MIELLEFVSTARLRLKMKVLEGAFNNPVPEEMCEANGRNAIVKRLNQIRLELYRRNSSKTYPDSGAPSGDYCGQM